MALLNRRDWLKAMLAGSAGALFPFARGASALSDGAAYLPSAAEAEAGPLPGAASSAPAGSGPAPYWLLAPLAKGSEVGGGWSIADLSPVTRGATVLTLAHASGERARIHLCRLDGQPRGIASSGQLDFVLMNGSDGATPSDENLGLVIMSLAKRVERNERLARAELESLRELLPHAQRVAIFGSEQGALT